MPFFLSPFMKQHKGLELIMDVTNRSRVIESLEQNAVDFYGIGFDTKNDILYVCDDNGFTANGTVFRYKSDGTVIDNFSSDGIGPNGLIFR